MEGVVGATDSIKRVRDISGLEGKLLTGSHKRRAERNNLVVKSLSYSQIQ